jgi:hypothetical protein
MPGDRYPPESGCAPATIVPSATRPTFGLQIRNDPDITAAARPVRLIFVTHG